MNRIDRLYALLILIQGRKFTPIHKIEERFNISKRTVFRDIRALEDAGVPIGNEPQKGYFIVDGYRDSLISQIWFWEKPAWTIFYLAISSITLIFGALVFQRLRPHFADVL